jgi:hypothetical protein
VLFLGGEDKKEEGGGVRKRRVVTWDGEAEYNCTRRGNPARHAHFRGKSRQGTESRSLRISLNQDTDSGCTQLSL